MQDKHYYNIFTILQQARTPRDLVDLVQEYPTIITQFLLRFKKDEYFRSDRRFL